MITEFEKIQRAKMYIDKMANGINPLTDEPASDDDMINNVRIARCLFYVSDILRGVIENDGKTAPKTHKPKRQAFFLTEEQKRQLSPCQEELFVRDICEKLNAFAAENNTKKLQPVKINNWLIYIGAMERNDRFKRATDYGKDLGIITEERISPNIGNYTVCKFNAAAQAFIYDNLDTILAFADAPDTEDEQSNAEQ